MLTNRIAVGGEVWLAMALLVACETKTVSRSADADVGGHPAIAGDASVAPDASLGNHPAMVADASIAPDAARDDAEAATSAECAAGPIERTALRRILPVGQSAGVWGPPVWNGEEFGVALQRGDPKAGTGFVFQAIDLSGATHGPMVPFGTPGWPDLDLAAGDGKWHLVWHTGANSTQGTYTHHAMVDAKTFVLSPATVIGEAFFAQDLHAAWSGKVLAVIETAQVSRSRFDRELRLRLVDGAGAAIGEVVTLVTAEDDQQVHYHYGRAVSVHWLDEAFVVTWVQLKTLHVIRIDETGQVLDHSKIDTSPIQAADPSVAQTDEGLVLGYTEDSPVEARYFMQSLAPDGSAVGSPKSFSRAALTGPLHVAPVMGNGKVVWLSSTNSIVETSMSGKSDEVTLDLASNTDVVAAFGTYPEGFPVVWQPLFAGLGDDVFFTRLGPCSNLGAVDDTVCAPPSQRKKATFACGDKQCNQDQFCVVDENYDNNYTCLAADPECASTCGWHLSQLNENKLCSSGLLSSCSRDPDGRVTIACAGD